MIHSIIFSKMKSFAILFLTIFRKAVCWITKRNSNCDVIPLTHVVSSTGEQGMEWDTWEEKSATRVLNTVQDHIDSYRKHKFQFMKKASELDHEEQTNFFDDMTPHITKQTKMQLNYDVIESKTINDTNRLNILEDTANIVAAPDLAEWQDSSGWDGENLENDTQLMLRENKRVERALQYQQKRQGKILNKSLGSRIIT